MKIASYSMTGFLTARDTLVKKRSSLFCSLLIDPFCSFAALLLELYCPAIAIEHTNPSSEIWSVLFSYLDSSVQKSPTSAHSIYQQCPIPFLMTCSLALSFISSFTNRPMPALYDEPRSVLRPVRPTDCAATELIWRLRLTTQKQRRRHPCSIRTKLKFQCQRSQCKNQHPSRSNASSRLHWRCNESSP